MLTPWESEAKAEHRAQEMPFLILVPIKNQELAKKKKKQELSAYGGARALLRWWGHRAQSQAEGGLIELVDRSWYEHMLYCSSEALDPPWAERTSTGRLPGTEPASWCHPQPPPPRAGAPLEGGSSGSIAQWAGALLSQQHGPSSRARLHLVRRDPSAP